MGNKILKEHIGKALDTFNNYDVVDCLYCKFVHIVPIPPFKKLRNTYTRNYYSRLKPDYFEKQKKT